MEIFKKAKAGDKEAIKYLLEDMKANGILQFNPLLILELETLLVEQGDETAYNNLFSFEECSQDCTSVSILPFYLEKENEDASKQKLYECVTEILRESQEKK